MKTIKSEHIILNISGWGNREVDDILACLSLTANVFKSAIAPKQFNKKPVLVENYTDSAFLEEHPKMYKVTPENRIYLNINNETDVFASYVTQFAHEYCHHLLDCDFYNTYDQFGWFEEVLCEVAGLYALNAVSRQSDADTAQDLQKHLQTIMSDANLQIEVPLNDWITQKQDLLSLDRYFRSHNKTIAVQLTPLFIENPELWNVMVIIKEIDVVEDMTFPEFISAWEALIPDTLTGTFLPLKLLMLGV